MSKDERIDELKQINLNCVEYITVLEAEIDRFWEAVYHGYLIETREEIEKDCKESWAEGTSPLEVAVHYMWKRNPKVAVLEAENRERAALELDANGTIMTLKEKIAQLESQTACTHPDVTDGICDACDEILEEHLKGGK